MEPNLPELPLRDIHLPAPVGWWPLAPGWWLLLVGIPLLVMLLVWLWRWLRRKTVKKLALLELESIERSALDARGKTQQLAILLRRTCLSVYPREQVASLVGEDWLVFLDGTFGKGKAFSTGAGRLLIEAPYRRECQGDIDALLSLCRAWLKQLSEPGKGSVTSQHPAPPNKPGLSKPENASENPAPEPAPADYRRFAKPTSGEEKAP
jgi:hypothetical protein